MAKNKEQKKLGVILRKKVPKTFEKLSEKLSRQSTISELGLRHGGCHISQIFLGNSLTEI